MNLQVRDLQQGRIGSDVAKLQAELDQLSNSVPSSEEQGSIYKAATCLTAEDLK